MSDRFKAPMNTSTSKSQFAFSKQARFPSPKPNTIAFGYDLKGQFGHKTGTGAGKGFSTSQKRLEPPHKNSSDALLGQNFQDR